VGPALAELEDVVAVALDRAVRPRRARLGAVDGDDDPEVGDGQRLPAAVDQRDPVPVDGRLHVGVRLGVGVVRLDEDERARDGDDEDDDPHEQELADDFRLCAVAGHRPDYSRRR
jgi:hypothetical protein